MRPSGYAGYAAGYAGEARGYASYAVTTTFPSHMCAHVREALQTNTLSRMGQKTPRNRVTRVTTRVCRVTTHVTRVTMHQITQSENEEAKKVWSLMDDDMKGFVTALVDLGMVDGRAGLARCQVAVFPNTLPASDGVVPYVPSKQERLAGKKTR